MRPAAWVAGLAALLPACAAAGGADAGGRLRALLAEEWEWRLEVEPLFATRIGRHEHDHRLGDVSPEALDRQHAMRRDFLRRARALAGTALGPQERLELELFVRQLESRVRDHELGGWRLPLQSDSGFHTELARLPDEMPLRNEHDYEDYLSRLRQVPRWMDDHVTVLRAGLGSGWTLPRAVLEGYEHTIAAHVVETAEASVFWAPFESLPESIEAAARGRLATAGRSAIEDDVIPAYARFLEFFLDEYRPGARTTVGAGDMPGGERWYAARLRHFTTQDLEPEEVHGIGLAEVARIEAEMQARIESVGFEGGRAAFLEHLRGDARFYARTPEELLERARALAKTIDGHLPRFFSRLPRQPYGVAPVPESIAPSYTAGRYVPAAAGSGEPGWYWVNTHDLPSRPLYALPALTLHEAVPGHHLQIALASERDDLPPFRRYDYLEAYGEGWALYAERLGLEMGLYADPYDDFGRLTYEMWRACRLVVDTGLHALGWSREQAREYLASRTALSLHEVRTEIDRYIAWPAQALAYKIGELAIRRLRAEAEQALGPAFDLRAFHDRILSTGYVPLDVLEALVREWIREQGATAA